VNLVGIKSKVVNKVSTREHVNNSLTNLPYLLSNGLAHTNWFHGFARRSRDRRFALYGKSNTMFKVFPLLLGRALAVKPQHRRPTERTRS
jgi:hypothetical protein